MKNIFKGYYRPTEDEFKTLWANAIFVFDTNVLLNLYRYQSTTRDALFEVMERLHDRVWIPYHVGLEFQRNRLKVIAEQHKRYSEVRNIITKSLSGIQSELDGLQLKKRHTHINPDKLVENINNIKTDFFAELDSLEEKSISVTSEDRIRERIDALFNDQVGNAPENQSEINSFFEDGEARYKNAIPPGFKDSSKDEKNPDEFSYSGLIYKRKFGDLIIWKQMIHYAEQSKLKNLIFITDDSKSDWWWKIDSNGSKTLGARPELIDEIRREANVENFYIYNTEGFLNYANEQLGTQVTKEAIEEVREISVARRAMSHSPRMMHKIAMSAEKAVYEWLSNNFRPLDHNRRGSPDLIGYQDDLKYGFEIKLLREPRMLMHRLKDLIYRSYYMLNEENYYEIAIIFVVLNEEAIEETIRLIKKRMPEIDGNLKIIIGKGMVDEDEGFVYDFIPYDEIQARNRM